MNKITLSGCPPWDGEYTFDQYSLTNRELNRIKTITETDGGAPIRAAEFVEAIYMNDRAAIVALTVVVLARAGKTVDPDDLWDSTVGAITLELGVGDDADPPTTASSENGLNEPETSSGDSSSTGGD